MIRNPLVMPGDVFNRLTAIRFSHIGKHERRHLVFKCQCGNEVTRSAETVRSGNTKSCGCLSRESKRAKRLPNDMGVVNQIVLQYKRHAKDRGIGFHLRFSDVDSIIRMPCAYCGEKAGNMKKTKNHDGFAHNGIDRIDSCLPYISSNVAPCCGICNKAKGTRGYKEFILWAKRIAMAEQWGSL